MQTSSLPYSSSLAHALCVLYEEGTTFLDQHKQTTFSAVEALFYNCAHPVSETAEDLYRLVHRVAFNNFHLLQTAFSAAQTLLAIHSSKQILLSLGGKLIQASFSTALGASLPSAVFTLVMLSASGIALSKVVQRNQTYRSKTQLFSEALQLTGVVQSLALAILTENKVSLLVRAATNAYSLCKSSQFNWLIFSKSYRAPPFSNIFQVDATYNALLYTNPSSEEKCSVCLSTEDEGEIADQTFCSNGHTFHRSCLEGTIASKKNSFCHSSTYTKVATKNYTNGVYTGTTYSYRASVKEKDLVGCPSCRERPKQNQLELTVHDSFHGTHNATVHVQESNPKSLQSTFEKAYALYNSFQGVLGLLQQVPEFTGGITLLRRCMIISDVVMGGLATRYLCSDEDGNMDFLKCIPSVLLTIPIFMTLESLFTPKVDLPSLLSSKEIVANWERPFIEKIHSVFDVYRFLTSIHLACTSKVSSVFNAASLLGQGLGLAGRMNVQWLRLDQENIGLVDAKLSTYATLSSTLSKTEDGVKSAIAYIANLQQRIINEGAISVVGHYTNGGLSYQTLEVFYKMEKIKDLREHLFKPYIFGMSGKGKYHSSWLTLDVFSY